MSVRIHTDDARAGRRKRGGRRERRSAARVAVKAEREVELPGRRRVGGKVAVVVGEGDSDLNDAKDVNVHLQALVPEARLCVSCNTKSRFNQRNNRKSTRTGNHCCF